MRGFGILFTIRKHFHDHITLLRVEGLVNKTNLTSANVSDVSVEIQQSERSCRNVVGLLIFRCLYDLRTVLTMLFYSFYFKTFIR
jgi:hypothetical protein